MQADYEILECHGPLEWRQWLDTHHGDTDGIWLRFYKKASGVVSVNYAQALDDALCYGWIDGQVKSYDEQSYLQKFTPRRSKSMWSKRNIEHVTRLIQAGLMTPAGSAEIDRAKADGRWQAAYDSPKNMVIPADFLLAVQQNQDAQACFDSLTKTQLFIIGWKLQTAKKPETRARRMAQLVDQLTKGIKPA